MTAFPGWTAVAAALLLGAVLMAAHAALRRCGAWLGWTVFVAAPLVLAPFWLSINADLDLFSRVKLVTVLGSAAWLHALRFTGLGQRGWALKTMPLLLAVNILEAVLKDVAQGHWALVGTGLLLVVTLPANVAGAGLGVQAGFRDLVVERVPKAWMVAFSAWNWAFLFANYPVVAGHQLLVLGFTLAVGWADARLWLQARFLVLATDLVLLASFRPVLLPALDTTSWSVPVAVGVASWGALAAAFWAALGGLDLPSMQEPPVGARQCSTHPQPNTQGTF